MAGLQYKLSGYRSYLRFSHEKHLLVEGRDDKRVFTLLLDELLGQAESRSFSQNIRIDTAEYLIDFGQVGNREKVEIVCQSISGLPFAEKLVGFVDRDFREFDRTPRLNDRIKGHKISDRLIWSRGHSIENYFFDFETLRNPLRTFSVTDQFSDALDLFESVFEQVICLACTASLAGDELQMLKLVKKSIYQEIFEISPGAKGSLKLKLDDWKDALTRRNRLSSSIADTLVERFRFWSSRVQNADFHVARWMCHGQIGLAFIWAAYSYCVLEVCKRQGFIEKDAKAEAGRVLRADESVRFNACADLWSQRALGNHCNYPVEVFRLLDLSISAG